MADGIPDRMPRIGDQVVGKGGAVDHPAESSEGVESHAAAVAKVDTSRFDRRCIHPLPPIVVGDLEDVEKAGLHAVLRVAHIDALRANGWSETFVGDVVVLGRG